jgi:exodeoxyribonuclease VII large subunit
MTQFSLDFLPERKVWSVSDLNTALREHLEAEFADIWVEGEISNLFLARSGHTYFTLKDAQAQLKCVLFKLSGWRLKFKPQDGLAVLARGRITVYEERGECQMIVEHLEVRGAGALQLAFEQLKKKLAAEGLFDQERKRPLPVLPRRVGIVTSPVGAVIADIVKILRRRFPGLHLRLYPVKVQGDGAAAEIVEGIRYFSRTHWPDLVIVGRGGGSLEDLWPFNEERVARAIAECAVPVISAVGHETDSTIADFVADLRAPTPSAAAELAVRPRAEFEAEMGRWEERLGRAWQYRGMRSAQRLDTLDRRLRERDPRVRLGRQQERRRRAESALEQCMRLKLERLRARIESQAAQLGHLSPLRVLERGYAVVQDAAGHAVRRAEETELGQRLTVRLAEGRLGVVVREKE